jgi:Glycine/D-amino acid oxidases (deaminating)
VIGTGVIGAAVAYELAQTGLRVVAIDRLDGVGSGSTSSSSSIVRFHYSTFEGVAASWESKFSWESWPEYLGSRPEESLARFIKTGCLILDGSTQRERVLPLFDRVGVPYQCWDAETIRQRVPGYGSRTVRSAQVGHGRRILGGCRRRTRCLLHARRRFIDDPQMAARNLMAAAKRRETEVQLREQVVAILQKNGRVQGIRLRSGSVIQSPVVVNAAGPYSGQVNALAGVTGEFRIRTRPLRQEVHSVPAPAGYAGGELGPAVTDGDLGTYFRSHFGGQLIVGSAEPACDALHWIDDPDAFEASPPRRRGIRRYSAWPEESRRWASRPVPLVSPHYMTSPTTGSRSTTVPHWLGSMWPLARVATS